MKWLNYYLNSTLGRKILIGLSGLALVGFIVAHLAGNLLLFVGEDKYNHYAEGLHANPTVLLAAEIGLLVAFLVHIILTLLLAYKKRAARPVGYASLGTKQGKPGFSPSKTMAITGTVVLLFLILHLMDMRFELRMAGPSGESEAVRTLRVLRDPLSIVVYFFGSLFLGYHVNHGFQSAFQSIGANHPKFSPLIKRAGVILAVVVAIGFASFPVYGLYTRWGG